MQNYIVTFGQVHKHIVNRKKFDRDCVCVIKANNITHAHNRALKIFGVEFHRCMSEDKFDMAGDIRYFKRGKVAL